MRKRVNLADHQAAMDILKQLYGSKEVKDDHPISHSEREPGTASTGEMDKAATEV
jgi:hypothetical protein